MDAIPAEPPIMQVMENRKLMISQLVSESKNGVSLMKSKLLTAFKLSKDNINEVMNYVSVHNDFTAYHLLFALRRQTLQSYHSLPIETRSLILCDALDHQTYLNDWGYLDPGGSYDGEAAMALLEIGVSALEPLFPILMDDSEVKLFGSESATMGSTYKYRRKDFAYRYVMLIRGNKPNFDPDPKVRDLAIIELKAKLDQENKGRVDQ